MVFVWSNLSDGEPHFTLSQVALNDLIMVFAFAPIVGLLLGLSAIVVPWKTLLLSVLLYIVVPVIVAQVIRQRLLASGGQVALVRVLRVLQPVSLIALLTTLVLLFGFQGEQIIEQPLIIALLAVPILIQVYFNSSLAYLLNRQFGVAHCVAAPSALIGASNFFELAVAAAISLFGFESGAALATVVGVLVEVPVMLSVVRIVNATRHWYESGAAVQRASRKLEWSRQRGLRSPDCLHGARRDRSDADLASAAAPVSRRRTPGLLGGVVFDRPEREFLQLSTSTQPSPHSDLSRRDGGARSLEGFGKLEGGSPVQPPCMCKPSSERRQAGSAFW